MAARSLTERVEILEQKVESLQMLPDRVTSLESQILQLRAEIHDGFSAIDLRFDGLDRQMREGDDETRHLMRVLHEDVIARISVLPEDRTPSTPFGL